MRVDVARFRAFLADRGHTAPWPDSRLWLALRLVQRLREGPGHPFRGNQHTGGIPGTKMASQTGAEGGGNGGGKPANGNSAGVKPVTKREFKREFAKRGEEPKKHHERIAGNLQKRLAAAGVGSHYSPATREGGASVYLKSDSQSRAGAFEVRIADHDPERKSRQAASGKAPVYNLDSRTISRKKVNDTLAQVVKTHKP